MLLDKHLILTQVITAIHDLNSSIIVDDMNLPISQCKGVRSYSHHPISNFSYQNLSPSYHSFMSKLSSICIPKNLQKALGDPKWRDAMQEEMMKALYKNNT